MTTEAKGSDNVADQGVDTSIGGTGFKTPEDLATGYLNLQKKLGEQGAELGTVRKAHDSLSKQAEVLAMTLKDQLGKGQAPTAEQPKVVDYSVEIAAVDKQIEELDPMVEGYQRTLATLNAKARQLTALDTKDRTLKASHEVFTKELSDRDVKAAHEAFYRENPSYSTPEMQAKIKEYIAKDRTGMSDSLSAFREIQRDEIAVETKRLMDENAVETKRLMDENAEYKKRLNLAKGTDETGKVIVKGQSPGQSTNQPKATGKDLDAGMAAALKAARGA